MNIKKCIDYTKSRVITQKDKNVMKYRTVMDDKLK